MQRHDLDHVALADRDTAPALRFLTGTLGGTVTFGGQSTGFRPMQVWVGTADGDGMSVELLEPWEVARNDFLARFLDRHGPGPHHLTFKVASLAAAIDRLERASRAVVNVDVSDPEWKEAFVLPRDAHGTVVQLAESNHDHGSRRDLLAHVAAHGPNANPRWWVDPAPASGPPARLRCVVLRTPDLDDALSFYGDLLGGEVVERDATGAELCWPRGARLRVEAHVGSPAGIDRLEVDGLAQAHEVAGTRFVPTR